VSSSTESPLIGEERAHRSLAFARPSHPPGGRGTGRKSVKEREKFRIIKNGANNWKKGTF